jgi:valyl-tRNA synthetase
MWEEGKKPNGEGTTDETEGGEVFAINWFENRLDEVRNEVEILMSQFRLSEALKTIYSLIWDDFCSWFLEWIKPEFGTAIDQKIYDKAVSFFDHLLQMLHPFMPFITEEIYHLLKERNDDLVVKQFAPVQEADVEILKLGDKLKNIITAVRDAKNKNDVKPKEKVSLYIETNDVDSYHSIKKILVKQTNADHLIFNETPDTTSIMTVVGNEKIYIKSDAVIDTSVQKEKLAKDLKYLKGFLIAVDKKLSNDKFVQNAKPEVIELERKKKQDAETKIKVIEQTLSAL